MLRHKALAGVAYEKNLLRWIANDALDDVLPILNDAVAARVRAYADQVTGKARAHLRMIHALVDEFEGAAQKEFALSVQARLDTRLHSVAFAVRAGADGWASMMEMLHRAGHSEPRTEQYRDLFEVAWFGTDLVLEDL